MTFIFTDLETTGLDIDNGRVLEVGFVVTDDALNEIGFFSRVIQQPMWAIDPLMDEYVRSMHAKSGLLDDLSEGDPRSVVEEDARRWLQKWAPDQTQPMCGSNVGNFDRPWMRHHLPWIESFFHYRNIDVSTVKELVKRFVGEKHAVDNKEKSKHRVLDDCRDTIEELTLYRDNGWIGGL